jgi:hypothetical protein
VPARAAPASLSEDAASVERAWAASSSRVLRLAPRFLYAGQAVPIELPGDAVSARDGECTTVAVIGARSCVFALESQPRGALSPERGAREEAPRRSVAGVLWLSRCGAERASLGRLGVRIQSARGALEVLVAIGSVPAPAVEAILPERTAGPLGSLVDVGPPPIHPEGLAARAARAERRMLGAGATLLGRRALGSDASGRGAAPIAMAPGCLGLVVLPDNVLGGAPQRVDLDAELRDARYERPIARDRSNAPDASLEACVGEQTPGLVAWSGALPGGGVTLVTGHWPIPKGIPSGWAPRARAAVASALRRRTAPQPAAAPVWVGLGVAGKTVAVVPTEPGGCYLGAVGASRGDAKAVRVTLTSGMTFATDTGGAGADGAAATFCAVLPEPAMLEIDASGIGLHWTAALWKVGRVALGTEDTR